MYSTVYCENDVYSLTIIYSVLWKRSYSHAIINSVLWKRSLLPCHYLQCTVKTKFTPLPYVQCTLKTKFTLLPLFTVFCENEVYSLAIIYSTVYCEIKISPLPLFTVYCENEVTPMPLFTVYCKNSLPLFKVYCEKSFQQCRYLRCTLMTKITTALLQYIQWPLLTKVPFFGGRYNSKCLVSVPDVHCTVLYVPKSKSYIPLHPLQPQQTILYHRIKDDRIENSLKGIRIWHCVFAASIILCSTPT